ncbi:helix-turn-helix domain-containing protein [Limibaculum sp. M0105]|uniref:Helix-turn-helix domain-containing protein n=1 Tax=Thermohalobaculum xanthum TaxID=2753746 RepID=A0A8J7M699_9RHOB|nr:helix-turn-helix transcriptional regulator [Thermohalobaculum xanthum]MBK0399023.1 helix-turn-helix domain-containing protein [Thermohalobaculum xanthum]
MFQDTDHFEFAPTLAQRKIIETAHIGDVRLCRVTSTGHLIRLRERHHATILVPRQGRLRIDTPKGRREAGPGQVIVLLPSDRETTVIAGSAGFFRCDCALIPVVPDHASAKGAAMHLAVAELAGVDLAATRLRETGWVRQMMDLYVQAASEEDSFLVEPAAREAASVLIRETLYELAIRQLPREMRVKAAPGQDWRIVRRAEELMEARLSDPLSIADVAAEIGVSSRRLQQAFGNVRNCSPRERLTAMRLDAARRHMLEAGHCATVSEVALACGFGHFGRFAAAYANKFGELPSVTLGCSHG